MLFAHYLLSAISHQNTVTTQAVCCLLCVCLLPLTLHGLDQALDSVGSDTESSTLLHQDRRDVAVHVQVVHRLWLQAQRVHELPAGGDETSQLISAQAKIYINFSQYITIIFQCQC